MIVTTGSAGTLGTRAVAVATGSAGTFGTRAVAVATGSAGTRAAARSIGARAVIVTLGLCITCNGQHESCRSSHDEHQTTFPHTFLLRFLSCSFGTSNPEIRQGFQNKEVSDDTRIPDGDNAAFGVKIERFETLDYLLNRQRILTMGIPAFKGNL